MSVRCLPLPCGCVLIALASACGVRDNVFAHVGRHKVEVEAFQAHLGAATGQEWQAVDDRVARRLLDQFLDQEVVAAAVRQDRELRIPIEPGARSATVRGLLREACGAAPAVDQALLESEVQRRLGEVQAARAHVRQILLDTQEAATEVWQRLGDGEDFVDLSRAVSRAPNADEGGEIGFVVQGTLPGELEEVIFSLAAGEISEPVQGPGGFHIFQVLETIPEGSPDRGEIESRVVLELQEQTSRRFVRECVDRLADKVGVEVFGDHLWFEYEGRYAEAKNEAQG